MWIIPSQSTRNPNYVFPWCSKEASQGPPLAEGNQERFWLFLTRTVAVAVAGVPRWGYEGTDCRVMR